VLERAKSSALAEASTHIATNASEILLDSRLVLNKYAFSYDKPGLAESDRRIHGPLVPACINVGFGLFRPAQHISNPFGVSSKAKGTSRDQTSGLEPLVPKSVAQAPELRGTGGKILGLHRRSNLLMPAPGLRISLPMREFSNTPSHFTLQLAALSLESSRDLNGIKKHGRS
jgi:hypothetical protein